MPPKKQKYTAAEKAAHHAKVAKLAHAAKTAHAAKQAHKSRPLSASAIPHRTIKGRGEYKVLIDGVPAGQAVGGMVGSMFGQTGQHVGALLGRGAHWLFKKITGKGAYRLPYRERAKALNGGLTAEEKGDSILSSKIPAFHRKGEGIVVQFEELVGNVYGSQNFVSKKYQVNPGLSGTFPWLSNQAVCYQQYELQGAIFQFRSFLGDDAANGQIGQVGLASDYNASDTPYQNWVSAMDSDFSNSAKASESFLHPLECAASETTEEIKYVRAEGVQQGDLRWTDHCSTQVLTQGFPAAMEGKICGELWVSYSVRFLKPNMSVLSNGRSAFLNDTMAAPSTTASFVTSAQPRAGSTLGLTYIAGNAISLPKIPGQYMLLIVASTGTGSFSSGFSLNTASSDISAVNTMGQALNSPIATLVLANNAVFVYTFNYKAAISAPVADFTFTMPSSAVSNSTTIATFLYSREPGLAINAPLSIEQQLCALLSKAQPQLGDSDQAFVVRTSVVDGITKVEQWPYNGPIPPVESQDAGHVCKLCICADSSDDDEEEKSDGKDTPRPEESDVEVARAAIESELLGKANVPSEQLHALLQKFAALGK